MQNDNDVLTFIESSGDNGADTYEKQRIQAVMEALEDDSTAYISVRRQNESGKSPESFVTNVPADKFTVDELLMYLQTNHGGGDYRLRLIAKVGVISNRLYSVAPLPEAKQKDDMKGAFESIANMIAEQNKQMMQVVQSMNNKPEKTLVEQLNEMQMLQQTFGTNQAVTADPVEQMRKSLEMIEAIKQMSGNQEQEQDELGGMFEKFMGVMGSMRQRNPVQQIQPKTQPVQQPTQTDQRENEMSLTFKMGLKTLINAANKNADAGNYGGMIIDNVTDEQLNEFFATSDGLDKLIQIEPQLALKKQWFSDLIEHVKALRGDSSSKYATEYGLTENAENDKNESS